MVEEEEDDRADMAMPSNARLRQARHLMFFSFQPDDLLIGDAKKIYA